MTVELHMLPVKAGDATLIIDRSDGRPHTVLIDAGLAKNEVVSYLSSVGVYHLDLIILTHPDLDHLQGLLALVENPFISLGQVWCFDLAFLRDFVTTRKIPPPKKPTHEIIYYLLLETLDSMDKVLHRLGEKKVRAFQVSAGHRLSLGSLYIEVLYPWPAFYDALSEPRHIRELLAKKWPASWMPTQQEGDNQPAHAREITAGRQSQREIIEKLLAELISKGINECEPQPLAMPNERDASESEDEEPPEDQAHLPISMLGTLYNNLSIVVKIHVTGDITPLTMLFPGDLTDWTWLLATRLPDLSADIFKYPHHGSRGQVVSWKALRSLGSPFSRCRPHVPACDTECCRRYHDYWRRLDEAIDKPDAFSLFMEVVRPQHMLVYPYPPKLPKPATFQHRREFQVKLHANRRSRNIKKLALPEEKNKSTCHVLQMGNKRDQIRTLTPRV